MKWSVVILLTLPAASISRSERVCGPAGRSMKVMPVVQVCQRPLSSWHCVTSPGMDGVQVKVPVLTRVRPAGPPVTVGGDGGVVSRTQLIVSVVDAVPAVSTCLTLSVCGPSPIVVGS